MRDLVRISDAEMQELTGSQRLRMLGAFSIAMACGVVALHGMVALFTDAKVVPLPGMNQLPGQIAWATGLVAMLVAVTFLVRGVIKRRLQWAIALSLAIHFLLCASMTVVEFRGPLPVPSQAAEFPGAIPEEFTLPDYAGEETQTSEPLWQKPTDTETPENDVDIERLEMQLAEANKPQPVDVTQTQVVEKLDAIERQEQVRLAADASAEMERQTNDIQPPTPEQLEAPDVTAVDIDEPTLNAQMEVVKQSSQIPAADRAPSEVASSGQQPEVSRLQSLRNDAVGTSDPSVEAPAAGGASAMTRRNAEAGDAVGTTANEVGVAEVGETAARNGESLIAGPASTSVGRMTNGLPSRSSSRGTNSGLSNPVSSAGSEPGPPRSSTAALAGRGTEPSALLENNPGTSGGANSEIKMSRSAAAISGIPAEAALAEQSGTLVFAGPQAESTGVAAAQGRLSGPRMTTVPRRSAGLPGSSGPATIAAVASGANAPQRARVAVGSPRTGISNAQPKLPSSDAIAGMIRKSAPEIGGSLDARVPESLSMRTSNARREAAKTLGGSAESEESVERGLEWLARNQYPDGHWSINDFPGETATDVSQGSFRADSAATGLALLAYLGAGYTHQSGQYQDVVNRGVQWLLKRQKPDGDLFAEESDFVQFYSHGMAAIALCEAYGLTKDAALKAPAQKALDFIIASQHPEFGGWRYRARFESDTSVSGWQLMALKSGEMSGLTVPKDAYVRVGKWLDSVQSKTSVGLFSYHPTRDPSPAMTAEALLMRQYLGAKRDDAQLIAGANYLQTRLPDSGQRDSYYWYYATQVMFHMQGDHWNAWNNSLRDLMVETQSKDGATSGSWDPARPSPEKWSKAGGRHYLTCLNLLMLEVYYRHLPLYLELEK